MKTEDQRFGNPPGTDESEQIEPRTHTHNYIYRPMRLYALLRLSNQLAWSVYAFHGFYTVCGVVNNAPAFNWTRT